VNLRDLAKLPAGSEVTPESLRETGVVRSLRHPLKLLADGDVAVALTVRAHRVSPAARAKIEAAGGTVEELTPRPPKAEEEPKSAKAKENAEQAEASTAQEDTPTAEAATSEAKAKRRPKKGAAQEDTPTAEAATGEAKAKRRPKKGAAQPDAIGEEPTPEPEPASEE
jgi:hypothetical protein